MIGQLALVRETDEAEASLCALSFQSLTVPSRHVWIDTDLHEVGIGLDLEDWQRDDEWDDAVARVKASSALDAVEVVGIWLSGARLSDWYTNINQEYGLMQPKEIIQLERMSAWQLLNRNSPAMLKTIYRPQIDSQVRVGSM